MTGSDSELPREEVLFLVRAQSRTRIMEVLAEAEVESMTQGQLRGRMDASRTTVSRALNSLTEQGWVVEVNGSYRLTRTGHYIATGLDELLDTVSKVDRLDEFLRWFPPDVSAPDFPDASDVSVTYSTEAAPYAPARKQSEILRTAERLRVLLPAVDIDSTETLVEQVTDHSLDIETIVSQAVASELESDEFAPRVNEMVRNEGVSIQVAQDDIPFYLGLADSGTVQIGLAGEEGLPRALLETTDEDVYEWADRFYRDSRDHSVPKGLEDF